ncbi:substrate-binding domain-containing protein [Paraburkholderia acidisoli]|uniref:Substrate-binding domain-containing protein n=1 Tax=Paraburkholderia acidisoli TaxID=2571748 RepID=A0A7Z2JIW5_9BURK|nr:substrate-binding domain-containing protein [Paraburkholderia acidisoli]QGZ65588.1 substrate-binding domain-containing protein [Paraburkholderia acidisoli]
MNIKLNPVANLLRGLTFAALAACVPAHAASAQATPGQHYAYIAPALDLPFWRVVGDGVAASVKAHGGTIDYMDSHNDASTQLKNAQDAIAQGVAGIVLSPTDSTTAPSVLAIAKQHHIPVSIAGIGTTSGEYNTYVGSEDEKGAYAVGKALAQVMTQKGWQKGGYGIVTISLGRENGKLRTAGFRRAMTEAGIHEVALNQMQKYTPDETFSFVQDMMTAHPDMHAIFVETDTPTLGAARAIRIAHRDKDMALVAFDGIPEFIDMLKKGQLVASGMQQPFLMGQQAADGLYDASASQKNVSIPVLLVTPANVDSLMPVINRTVMPKKGN